MSLIGGVIQRVLLHECASHIKVAVQKCNSKLPPWKACFKDGSFSEVFATKTLHGKVKDCTVGHNGLHATLSSVSALGNAIDLKPRLQDHDITGADVAIALDCISSAKDAHVICSGVDLLAEWRDHPTGLDKAAAFVEQFQATHTCQVNLGICSSIGHQRRQWYRSTASCQAHGQHVRRADDGRR